MTTPLLDSFEDEGKIIQVEWYPIGYQVLTVPGIAKPIYQLRVYAELEKIGEFEHDPGGSVIGYKLVSLSELNKNIEYGIVGERMMKLVASNF